MYVAVVEHRSPLAIARIGRSTVGHGHRRQAPLLRLGRHQQPQMSLSGQQSPMMSQLESHQHRPLPWLPQAFLQDFEVLLPHAVTPVQPAAT